MAAGPETFMQLRIAGYGARKPLPELWDLQIHDGQLKPPECIRGESDWGLNWSGEYEALDRLIVGAGSSLIHMIQSLDSSDERLKEIQKARENEYAHLCIPAMPIQDAIDLAKFLVETTIGFLKFAVFRQPKTAGGPIEIAAITKHEGFRWIQRKHFYPTALNP